MCGGGPGGTVRRWPLTTLLREWVMFGEGHYPCWICGNGALHTLILQREKVGSHFCVLACVRLRIKRDYACNVSFCGVCVCTAVRMYLCTRVCILGQERERDTELRLHDVIALNCIHLLSREREVVLQRGGRGGEQGGGGEGWHTV